MVTVKQLLSTYCLFVLPTFLSGCASAFDMFGSLFRFNVPVDDRGDLVQIQKDWMAVGSDIQEALNRFAQNNGR